MPAIKRGTVAPRPVIHEVEASEEADARWAAGRALAEMIAEKNTVFRELIEVRRLHDRMADGAEAVAPPLICADEENVGVWSAYHGGPHRGYRMADRLRAE